MTALLPSINEGKVIAEKSAAIRSKGLRTSLSTCSHGVLSGSCAGSMQARGGQVTSIKCSLPQFSYDSDLEPKLNKREPLGTLQASREPFSAKGIVARALDYQNSVFKLTL